ncbi:MAG: hypothetical protein COU35_00885 [Candidatus Magasanikbacteria bacterium CG10_big_fil_rev_8_21_14_0_10_47_10]|uniref:PPM-type phosphatase domain-containing protein n=1 Tax=Candidatus Magasanikbacteria bacterium CG10_big_fil_rev_8_21_14_0_10_47_10 TaxID=1974652 RepID=A0A2H0TRD4_9BACT|nr:MAG: hypothetical protein COU35_00885 [Candidatus Magasanikbacteria bacterium CG10_big_fil_rev_8_21_14_0_10_47_10]
MSDSFELFEFFVEGRGRKGSHVLLHISEPSPGEESRGHFLAVCEIEQPSIQQVEHLQKMIDDIEFGYYDAVEEDSILAFERRLEFMNRRSRDILGESRSRVHCFLAVVRDDKILFAVHGAPFAHVLYKGKQHWKDINIAEQSEATPPLLFSSVTEGSLATDDFLFVSSAHVEDYVEISQLQKLLESRPVADVAAYVQKTLESLKDSHSYGGFILHKYVKRVSAKTPMPYRGTDHGSHRSIQELRETQSTTDETLSPPVFKGVHAAFFRLFAKPRTHVKGHRRTSRSVKKGESGSEQLLVIIGRAIVVGLLGLYQLVKAIFIAVAHTVKLLFLLITNHGKQREMVIDSLRSSLHSARKYIFGLPLLSKVLFLSAIILAFVFVFSIVTTRVQEKRVAEVKQYEQLIQAIREKTDAAQASLIYADDERALMLLQEAKLLVEKLPEGSSSNMDNENELTENIDSVLGELRKMDMVDVTRVANIAESFPSAITKSLEIIDGKLIAFSPGDEQLYSVEISTGRVDAHPHGTIPNLSFSFTPKEEDRVIFLTASGNAAAYDPLSRGIIAKEISYPISDVRPAGAVVYNTRLYVLDRLSGQIYRHSPTQTGFDRGGTWLKEATDFADALGLAIDGDIFVLGANDVRKFTKGVAQPFSLSGLDPELDHPSSIWTYSDVASIYILEAANRRLIVLDKTGKLVRQYTSLEWTSPTGLAIDTQHGIAYILDSNNVYSLRLQ